MNDLARPCPPNPPDDSLAGTPVLNVLHDAPHRGAIGMHGIRWNRRHPHELAMGAPGGDER